jgi:iron(III) transport system ATP-binding protein
MSFLHLTGVSKRYGPVVALDGIEMQVAAGSRTAIVGPSGCGKTTLLRLIAGFEAPDAGRIEMAGETLADGARAVPAHRRGIGVVAQDGALFPHLSIADNIGFGIGKHEAGRDGHIAELAAMVGLTEAILRRRPHELSGGQQQRVALARALARKPRLMLLDEPFSALDTGLRASMRKAVADVLQAAGITTILVTHDQVEALSFADQVAVMRDGRFSQVGSPRDLYLKPVDPMVASFLGDAIVLPASIADGFADCRIGRIPVDAPSFHGEGEIMLRPEQILLQEAAIGAHGDIVEVDFGGSVCTLMLKLAEVAGKKPMMLPLRRSSIDMLGVGTKVRIGVEGRAHLFTST